MFPLSYWAIPHGVNASDVMVGYDFNVNKGLSCPIEEFISFFSGGANPWIQESHQEGQLLKFHFQIKLVAPYGGYPTALDGAIAFLSKSLATQKFAVSRGQNTADVVLFQIVCPELATEDLQIMKEIATMGASVGLYFETTIYSTRKLLLPHATAAGLGNSFVAVPVPKYRYSFFDHVVQAVSPFSRLFPTSVPVKSFGSPIFFVRFKEKQAVVVPPKIIKCEVLASSCSSDRDATIKQIDETIENLKRLRERLCR